MYSGCVTGDPESSLTPPHYVTSHSHQSTSLTSTGTPSDGAVQLNRMYLEAKMNMLRIIEQGLQLKLDIQDIKDKFLRLINDFEEYEQLSRCPGMLPPYLPEMPVRQHAKMSPAQRRVWAFYELRRARIQAKRSQSRSRDSETKRLKVKELIDQKENASHEQVSHRYRERMLEHSTSTPVSKPDHKYVDKPLSTITWSIQNFLTPIREEYADRYANNGCLNGTLHALNTSPQTSHNTSLYTGDGIPVPYATIPPDCTRVDHRPLHRQWSFTGSEDLSANIKRNWNISPSNSRRRSQSTNDLLHCTQVCRPFDKYSQRPVQTALSETICDVYTNNSLKDISVISKATEGVIEKSSSSVNTSLELNNTFNHPLHSTLDYPLHSTLTMEGPTLDTEYCPSDPRSQAIYKQNCKHYHMDLSPLKPTTDNACYGSDSSPNISHTPQNSFSPTSYRTPSKKPQAQLCKEHGIHPTFDGSCIFKNRDTIMPNSSDEELDHDENGNTAKASSNIRETDCDSSYLSESLEDHQSSIDIDHYVATYDSRKACIRLLKRQTGQVKLGDIKQPVGLSESDLYCDIINKHFSLEAMRSSLPDLSGLSTLPTSAAEDESSDVTLQASSTLKSHTGNIPQDSGDVLSPGDALMGNEQRLASLSADEGSPESNTAMPVPVNSPNITDSGGSSGKQNTDNYDYTEMQPQQPSATSDRTSLPGSYTTHSSQSCHSRRSQSLQSQHSHRSSKSYQPHHQSSPGQHHRHRRRYASTPAQLSDTRSSRTTKSRSSRHSNKPRHAAFPHPSVMCCQSGHHQSYDLDPGCSSPGTRPMSAHFTIRDNMGRQRTIVQHSPVSQHLPKERKKALVRKLKHFSNSFYRGTSTGNLQIQTLGHF